MDFDKKVSISTNQNVV